MLPVLVWDVAVADVVKGGWVEAVFDSEIVGDVAVADVVEGGWVEVVDRTV